MINNLLGMAKGNQEFLKEWNSKFPGKCIVCSYHKFGYNEGMTSDPIPPKHKCLYEKRKKK